MKKLLFVVTGVGYGDATREHANIKEFLKQDPKTKVIVAGYDNSYKYFKGKYSVIKIKGYKIPGKRLQFNVLPFLFYNYLLPILWFFFAFKIKKSVKQYEPDIIISDFEPTGIPLAKIVGKKCVMVFGYDPQIYKQYVIKNKLSWKTRAQAWYFEQIYKRADHVIIPTFFPKAYPDKHSRVHLTIRQKPSEIDNKKELMNSLRLKKEPILVMLGGSDFGLVLAKEVKKLAKHYPKEQFLIFGGKTQVKPEANMKHYLFKDNLLDYMKVCKGVVTLAGQKTLAEALMFKKPMLIFPIKHHVEQQLNAFMMRNYAMIGKDVKKLPVLMFKFLKNLSKLREKVNKAEIKGGGSVEIVNVVNKILQD